MRVTADLFSGRPNPSWTLAGEAAARVDALVRALAPRPAPPPPDDAPLGYRGMVLEGAPSLAGCGALRVREGIAVADCGEGTRAWTDGGRALERALAASGRGAMDADAHAALLAATGG